MGVGHSQAGTQCFLLLCSWLPLLHISSTRQAFQDHDLWSRCQFVQMMARKAMGTWVPQCEHMGPLRMLEAESWSTLCGAKSTGAFPEVSQPWFCGCGDGVPGTWPASRSPFTPPPRHLASAALPGVPPPVCSAAWPVSRETLCPPCIIKGATVDGTCPDGTHASTEWHWGHLSSWAVLGVSLS